MRRLFLPTALLLLPAFLRAQNECVPGTQGCEKPAALAPSLKGRGGLKGFKTGLHCPPGFKAETAPTMRSFRCVADQSEPSEMRQSPAALLPMAAPGGRCPPGMQRLAPADDPLGEGQCVSKASKPRKAPGSYAHFRAGQDVEFDYPSDWKVSNGWADESPTIYIVRDTGQAGKKVSLLITENRKEQPGYIDMKAAIRRDKELQNAMEGGSGTVAGKYARFLYVPRESHTAYVQAGPELYYSLVFSAPEDLNKTFKPAYDKLLKSFRISGGSEEQ